MGLLALFSFFFLLLFGVLVFAYLALYGGLVCVRQGAWG